MKCPSEKQIIRVLRFLQLGREALRDKQDYKANEEALANQDAYKARKWEEYERSTVNRAPEGTHNPSGGYTAKDAIAAVQAAEALFQKKKKAKALRAKKARERRAAVKKAAPRRRTSRK